METSQYTNYAFISYQRQDEKWAKWLQRRLENYKLPAVARNEQHKSPEYIRPVFRDKTDLSGGVLAESLRAELLNSRFLIVICSPNSVRSEWVNREIQTFIDNGRIERVIPFIVAGKPFAEDREQECFPEAIRSLSRGRELLGINISENGKEQAFVRTVAYMLGLRFDELWQRHERRRRQVRLVAAIFALIVIFGLAGLFDYNRTRVEYYADWVDCRGVAEGIIPLNEEQVAHRYYSYRFEYQRVPFGEKGFYSWRLHRVSIVNSKGVVSSYVPDFHPFFYPVRDYLYTDGYVSEIINRDQLGRVTIRYAVKDDYDGNAACIIDMEAKEKRQGSGYMGGSTTTILTDVLNNQNKSKIKRFHYSRNQQGYITKITYHANDGDELAKSAIGDNNNIYGKVFELDSLGRVSKVTFLNSEGNRISDKHGVGCIYYEYDRMGDTQSVDYRDLDDHPVLNEQGYTRIDARFDEWGNTIENRHIGLEDTPTFNNNNLCIETLGYDSNGNMTEVRLYDAQRNPANCSFGYAIIRWESDRKGRTVKTSYYGVDGKPCYNTDNYSYCVTSYNSDDCIEEYSFYGIDDRPCIAKDVGVYCIKVTYDDYNYVKSRTFFDASGNRMRSPVLHYSQLINEYDAYHNVISTAYYDQNGKPCLSNDGVCRISRKYDNRGNEKEQFYQDTEGNPCTSANGVAGQTFQYDSYGNETEVRFWGVDGKPAYVNMTAIRRFTYFPNGLLKEQHNYDEDGQPCLDDQWVSVYRMTYDSNGNQILAEFLGKDSLPCYYANGKYAVFTSRYDSLNNRVEEGYTDVDGLPMLVENGFATQQIHYNERHLKTEIRFFDTQGMPCRCGDGYHRSTFVYDAKDRITEQAYYDTDNRLIKVNGVARVSFTYDIHGFKLREINYDNKGMRCNKEKSSYCQTDFEYDSLGRETRRKNYGPEGDLVSVEVRTYDERSNLVLQEYYDGEGNLMIKDNVSAVVKQSFDANNRLIEVCYYNEARQLMGGRHFKPIERYGYDSLGQNVRMSLFEKDGTLYTNVIRTFVRGRVSRLSFTDSLDNPQIMLLPTVNKGHPYASCILERNQQGQVLRESFFDERGELYENKTGIAYIEYERDRYGRMVKASLFNREKQPANDIVGKWSVLVRSYDERGNLTEESYYDKSGKMAHTPWGSARMLKKYDPKGNATEVVYYAFENGKWIINKKDLIHSRTERQGLAEEVQEERNCLLILFQVEDFGQMFSKGYHGRYFVLEYNSWKMYDGLDAFVRELMESRDSEKHVLIRSFENNEIQECDFSKDPLGARVMDYAATQSQFDDISEAYEQWKKARN